MCLLACVCAHVIDRDRSSSSQPKAALEASYVSETKEGLDAPPPPRPRDAAKTSATTATTSAFNNGSKEDKECAYQMFREGPGKVINTSLLEIKADLKHTKILLKVGGGFDVYGPQE